LLFLLFLVSSFLFKKQLRPDSHPFPPFFLCSCAATSALGVGSFLVSPWISLTSWGFLWFEKFWTIDTGTRGSGVGDTLVTFAEAFLECQITNSVISMRLLLLWRFSGFGFLGSWFVGLGGFL
jgi:hypothetical protein